ncbi:MAG TPA: SIMPL domain-containing protein [Pyrinomonadaceae bacterium]|nr:SIMPL domain-containing protein [Pyrinomonadaceae bacterium]
MNQMNRNLFAFVASTICALCLNVGARAQLKTDLALITVSGQAEVLVVPDEVVFTLEVVKMDRDLSAAKEQNDESIRQILALARRFAVAPQDVKTDYISVEMKYNTDIIGDDDDSDAKAKVKREFVGYEVSKTVILRFTNIARFEEFFSAVLQAGVSRVRDVSFRTSQIRKHKDEARSLAIRAAREKATALARDIGQTIGKAHSISEEGEGRSALSNNISTSVGGRFSDDENSTIAPGTIRVTAQVSVSFILL